MASTAPDSAAYDSEGNSIRGEFSLEFRAWCSVNHVDVKEGLLRQIHEGEDIEVLARTRDPRATELLVTALQSRNEFVLVAAARALALRRVTSAIPTLVAIAERLPAGPARVIAHELALYGAPEADREVVRIVKDPAKIIRVNKMAAAERELYDRTDRARLGLSSPSDQKPAGK
jgi:hypothetical protein